MKPRSRPAHHSFLNTFFAQSGVSSSSSMLYPCTNTTVPGSCTSGGQSGVVRRVGKPPDPPATLRRFNHPTICDTSPTCSLIAEENSRWSSAFE